MPQNPDRSGLPVVMPVEWRKPDWWHRIAPGTSRDSVEVAGLAYSLRGARPEVLLEFIHGWNLTEADLPDRAFGAYPLKADEVEAFLNSADALMAPAAAAVRMIEPLMALDGLMNDTALALNILDVWRHCHDLMVPDSDHGDHCSCLVNCRRMPQAYAPWTGPSRPTMSNITINRCLIVSVHPTSRSSDRCAS
jgi:hypothetical protein